MSSTYKVRGMHCGACEANITKAVRALHGVSNARASAEAGTLTIQSLDVIPREKIAAAVASAGDYTLLDEHGNAVGGPIELDPDGAENRNAKPASASDGSAGHGYRTLAILIGYLLLVAFLGTFPNFTLDRLMANFMGGFFLAFSFFKFLDLSGFAASYARYDLVAEKWKAWRYIYPFVELMLGMAFLAASGTNWLIAVNIATLILMVIGTAGVIRSLVRKDQVRCACLGAVINLPLGVVTLIEDLGMAAMAAFMLYRAFSGEPVEPGAV